MVVEHPSGALFVSGYNRSRPALWKSVNGGATWTRLAVGGDAQGAVGNSDVDLAVARDGTLYFVELVYDIHRQPRLGERISVGASPDGGVTWRWTALSQTLGDDRPWVAVAPDGTAHVIWSDLHGVNHAVSRDRGRTWTRPARVSDRGGSSHLAVGPHGEVAVRVGPGSAGGAQCDPGADLVVVSTDAGTTWRPHQAPGAPRPSGCLGDTTQKIPRWVDPVAWDAAGALYTLWTTASGVWLGRSADQGAHWATWRVAAEAPDTAFFPYLVARAAGQLAATWFMSAGDSVAWRAARIDVRAAAGAPRVATSAAMPLESWLGSPPQLDLAGEYLAIVLLPDGSAGVVTPIQHQSARRLGFTWWRFVKR